MSKQETINEAKKLLGVSIDLFAIDTEMVKLDAQSIFDYESGENLVEYKNPSYLFYDKEEEETYEIMIEFAFVNKEDETKAKSIVEKYYNDEIDGSDLFDELLENHFEVKITAVDEL